MKRSLSLLIALLLSASLLLPALAEGTLLDDVFPREDYLYPGQGITVDYTCLGDGHLRVTLHQAGLSAEEGELFSQPIELGTDAFTWDGLLDGQSLVPGSYMLKFVLTDTSGESSVHSVFFDVIEAPAATPAPQIVSEAQGHRQVSRFSDPHDNCFWQMNPNDYDVYDPEDQQKIWEIMMQPVTVLNVGPKEHVYPVVSPGASSQEVSNLTGQLHGTTQAVHVLETGIEGGWAHIEAFSNDGYRAPDDVLHDFGGLLIDGYVKESLFKVVTPNPTYGILIDKKTQRLYIFQDGKLISELLVSTGRPSTSQPYLETPAGEFLVDSWVGMFVNGRMQCDKALRINGGVLLHEVPHEVNADGTRNYGRYEPYLSQKASHGCVRIQRLKNKDGINMSWLWDNLKKNTKVLIWDDVGRSLTVPESAHTMYYNPDGGKYYHSDENCGSVREKFLPLTSLSYEDLYNEPYDTLIPCFYCTPFVKLDDPNVVIPDDVIGGEVDI